MKTAAHQNKRLVRILAAALLTFGSTLPRPAWTQSVLAQAADSLDAILKDLAGYNFAQGVGAPLRLRAYIFAHKDDPAARQEGETKLQAFLRSGATAAGKMEACRSLRLIGSAASVPALEELLAKAETSDAARYALERIPGAEADRALLAGLGRVSGEARRGIVASLGERGTAAAVVSLAELAAGGDRNLAFDAARALGKIDSPEAVRTLGTLLDRTRGPLRLEAGSALLVRAQALLKAGRTNEAAAAFNKVQTAGLSPVLSQAAFKGKIGAAGLGGKDLILKALAGGDAVLLGPAIASVRDNFKGDEVEALLPFLAKLPAAGQTQLLAVLADYRGPDILAAVLKAADGPSPEVRTEALRTVEKIGDGTVVEFLAGRAAGSTGAEQKAAREALARLRGADVDEALVKLMPSAADEKVKAELIEAAGDRRIPAVKPVLMATVASGSPVVQRRAAEALRTVAGPADLRDLLALLFGLEDETARETIQDVAAAVARTNIRPLARGDTAENMLAVEKDAAKRADLLRVLGKIGDETALPLLRAALGDPDASVVESAVRAFADWPTVAARDDVLLIARTSTKETHRVLALRAYIRMLGLERYREPRAVVADLREAVPLAAGRAEEKLAILALLPRFACQEALDFANSLAADETVRTEAQLAADQIRQTLAARNR